MARRRQSTHEDAEETRRNIVRTAQQLFMEYGFRAVSTRQIAAICGLTQPALYHYFADKQLGLSIPQHGFSTPATVGSYPYWTVWTYEPHHG